MRDRSEQWAPGLMRDALYEYTLSSDCVGGDVKYLRRRPAIAIPATSWEPTTKQLYMDAQAETLCPACNGNGAVSNMDPFGGETTYECPDCRGHGVRLSHDAAPGGDA